MFCYILNIEAVGKVLEKIFSHEANDIQDVARGFQEHGWNDLCRGPLVDITTYYMYKL